MGHPVNKLDYGFTRIYLFIEKKKNSTDAPDWSKSGWIGWQVCRRSTYSMLSTVFFLIHQYCPKWLKRIHKEDIFSYLSIDRSIYLSISPSIYLSIYIFIYLYISIYIITVYRGCFKPFTAIIIIFFCSKCIHTCCKKSEERGTQIYFTSSDPGNFIFLVKPDHY